METKMSKLYLSEELKRLTEENERLKERDTPRKVERLSKYDTCMVCPNCGEEFSMYDKYKYCHNCGQKLSWEEK